MMMPPGLVSLPLKLLMFVMVDGWFLIVQTLLMSVGGPG
jgi:flagellar biosynthetic protein FliP